MYKTFQGMDDLQQMVEQAYGVPMTSNCMVPRREVLDILDEMRNAIPIEMDDAQDVLDHRDDIVADAQDQADATISSCLLYTSPSPRDQRGSRMPSSA